MNPFEYCLITDRSLYRIPVDAVAAAAELAGVHFIVLREKDLPPAGLVAAARAVRKVLHRTKLIINGCLDVALVSGAEGVHLQKDNLPVRSIRERFPELIIGYSAHSVEEMKEAEQDGADYVFVSPVFAPASKTSPLKPLGTNLVSSWCRSVKIKVFGLGGISAGNVGRIRDCGCDGAAGISLFIENGEFTSKGMVI